MNPSAGLLDGQGFMRDKGLNVWGMPATKIDEFYMLPDAEPSLLDQLGGGGGGGRFGVNFGQQPYNDMEKTILAHDYPGGFKVATDQYAAKYSDQLDAWAKEELKQKYPKGAATGLSWDKEFDRQKKLKDDYQLALKRGETPQLWGPGGPTGRTAETVQTVWKKPPPSKVSRPTLSGVVDRDRSGLNLNRARPTPPANVYTNFGRWR